MRKIVLWIVLIFVLFVNSVFADENITKDTIIGVAIWYDQGWINVFPNKKGEYYLHLSFAWPSSPYSFLLKKYMDKNQCKTKSAWKETGLCIEQSWLEHYLDLKVKIKVKKIPSFMTLKKDKDWRDYFEIDWNNNYEDIWDHALEFDIFINNEKKWFTTKLNIKIIKPIILAVWELWIEGGIIFNNWRDIWLTMEKWILDKTYKIAHITSVEWINTWRTFPEISDRKITSQFNSSMPSRDIVSANYLRWPTYWTTTNVHRGDTKVYSSNFTSDEMLIYNKCINNKSKSDIEKYRCFREYMGFEKETNASDITQSNSFKKKLTKNLIISKIQLLKSPLKKFIPKLERVIVKLPLEKLEKLKGKLDKLDMKKYKKIWVLLEYIKAKIDLEIYNKQVAK